MYLIFTADLDREVYFNSFMPYLSHLHFVVEQWSKMSHDVKSILVNYGAFHLLLNELHTAPTVEVRMYNYLLLFLLFLVLFFRSLQMK